MCSEVSIFGRGHAADPLLQIRSGGALNQIRTFDYASEAELFDFSGEAELFSAKGRKLRHQMLGYKRFARAADAIRFAIEEMPPEFLVGTYLEANEARYESQDIRRLYESAGYPHARRTVG
jgi:hypothetical protein